MCNLYTLTEGPQKIRDLFDGLKNKAGNLRPGDVYPDTEAAVVRASEDGARELVRLRWGMPSPSFALKGRETDPGVTNIRNVQSPHWRRWLGVEHRCVVPANRFCEWEAPKSKEDGPKKTKVWFALDESEPLFFFAGAWTPWHGVRKRTEGEADHELFAFLTTEANKVVKPIHPKAMPVILRGPEEVETWLSAPPAQALKLQKPLPDDALTIVGRGEMGGD